MKPKVIFSIVIVSMLLASAGWWAWQAKYSEEQLVNPEIPHNPPRVSPPIRTSEGGEPGHQGASSPLHRAAQENNPVEAKARYSKDGKGDAHGTLSVAPPHLKAQRNSRTVPTIGMDRLMPLHEAVYKDRLDVVKFRLENGADVEVKNSRGEPLLHYAVSKNNLKIVAFLLANGASVKSTDRGDRMALHRAANIPSAAMVELLLDRGARINAITNHRRNALFIAAENNGRAVAQLLLDNGINILFRDRGTQTALHIAARYNSVEVAEVLIAFAAGLETKDGRGQTPLHFAAKYDRPRMLTFLLSQGANINDQDKDGQTALHLAAGGKYNGVIAEILLAHRAAVDLKNKKGQTPVDIYPALPVNVKKVDRAKLRAMKARGRQLMLLSPPTVKASTVKASTVKASTD